MIKKIRKHSGLKVREMEKRIKLGQALRLRPSTHFVPSGLRSGPIRACDLCSFYSINHAFIGGVR